MRLFDRPENPLHTNGSENDIRCQVIRRKVSGMGRESIGWLFVDEVALARARARILVIGDRDRWKTRRYFDALAGSLPIVDEASIRAEIAEIRFDGQEKGELAAG